VECQPNCRKLSKYFKHWEITTYRCIFHHVIEVTDWLVIVQCEK